MLQLPFIQKLLYLDLPNHFPTTLAMNISSTAGFASGPRSRWDDFWRSFPAPFSAILEPKTMMPCLYAGMLLIPVRVESNTELNATRAPVFPCKTAMLRNRSVSAALAVNSLGIAIGLPHPALVTLLALLPTDSDQSSWKGICSYCTN